MWRIVLGTALAIGLTVAAAADEVILKSGVILHGRVTPVGDDLRVDLDSGGRMTVPRGLVEEIRPDARPVTPSPRPPAPTPAPAAVPTPAAPPPAPAPRRWSAPAAPPPPPPATGPVYERQGLRPPPAPCPPPCPPVPCDPCAPKDPCEPCRGMLEPWFISLGLAYTQAGGNSESLSFKFDFEVKYERDPWTWLTTGFYVYGESGGVADTNRFFIESKLERKITSVAYGFLLGSYDIDEPGNLDYRLIGTVGVGTTLLKAPMRELRGEVGLGATAEQRTGQPETVDPSAYLGLDYEQEWTWGGRLVLDYDFIPNLGDWDLSLMRLDAKFEVPLSACLNFRLGLRLDYQFQPADPTAEKLDWILSAGLSMNF